MSGVNASSVQFLADENKQLGKRQNFPANLHRLLGVRPTLPNLTALRLPSINEGKRRLSSYCAAASFDVGLQAPDAGLQDRDREPQTEAVQ